MSHSRWYQETLYQVWLREKGICLLCGFKVPFQTPVHGLRPTREHFIPRSKGGSNMPENIRLSHLSCNSMRERHTLKDMQDKIKHLAEHSGTPI